MGQAAVPYSAEAAAAAAETAAPKADLQISPVDVAVPAQKDEEQDVINLEEEDQI